MIYLYDGNTTDFKYNGTPLSEAYDVVVDRTLNSSFYVSGKYPINDSGKYKTIQKNEIIKVHTPDGMQPFRIMDVQKTMRHVEFEAWPLFFADMRSKKVRPFAVRGATGHNVITTLISRLVTKTNFDIVTNITETHDFTVRDSTSEAEDPNRLYDFMEVFKRILRRWNAELYVDGYDVRIVSRIGQNTDALLYEHKNITDFVDHENVEGIITRVHGKSDWTDEDGNNFEVVRTVDSPLIDAYNGVIFEKQYTNNDIRTAEAMDNWLRLKFSTDNIDKPSREIKVDTNIIGGQEVEFGDSLILKFLTHDVDMSIRVVRYEYDGFNDEYLSIYVGDVQSHFSGTVRNQILNANEENRQAVREAMAQTIINASGNRIVYSSQRPQDGVYKDGDTWFDTENNNMYHWDDELQDWVLVEFGVEKELAEQQAKLEAFEKDLETNRQQANKAIEQAGGAVDLANQLEQNYQDVKASTDSAMNKAVDAYTDAQSALASIDGIEIGGRNYWALAKESWNTNNLKREGDIFRNISTNKNFSIFSLNRLNIPIGETYTTSFEIKALHENLQFNNDTFYVNGVDTSTGHNKPFLVKDKWVKVFATFKYTVENSNRVHIYFNDLIGNDFEIRNFQVEKGNKATDWTPAPEDLNEEIANAWNQANQALENIDTLDQSVKREVEALDNRLSLKANQVTVNELNSTLTTQKNRLDHTIDGLGLKADREEVDTLNRTVTQHDSQIKATANGLELKADKNVVDELNQTVEQQGLLIDATNEGLNLKANSSEVDNLAGRVSSAENDISVNANEISKRLTSTQVNNLINGKGFATQTYVSNQVKETADSLERSISSVRTTANNAVQRTSIDYQNLLQTASLYERVLGSSEGQIESNVSRVVQTSGLVQSEVADALNGRKSENLVNANSFNGLQTGYFRRHRLNQDLVSGRTYRAVLEVEMKENGGSTSNSTSGVVFRLYQMTDETKEFREMGGGLYEIVFDYNGDLPSNELRVNNRTGETVRYKVNEVYELDPNSLAGAVRTVQSQLNNAWAIQALNHRDDILSEIALSDSNVRIKGKNIHLDGNTLIDGNLITNRMLAADISADKITTGTLDASRARIINIDANNITANATSFVQSFWNNIHRQIRIDNDGISIQGDDAWRKNTITQVGIEFFSGSGAYDASGVFGLFKPNHTGYPQFRGDHIVNTDRSSGTPLQTLGLMSQGQRDITLGIESSYRNGITYYEPIFEIIGRSGNPQFYRELNMNSNNLVRINTARFEGNGRNDIGWWSNYMNYHGQNGHRFYAQGTQLFNIQVNGYANMYLRLNMQGNDIYNATNYQRSDVRLKKNIEPSTRDSLSKIRSIDFYTFEYSKENTPKGLQHGVLAQQVKDFAPEWLSTDEEGYYMVSDSAMNMDGLKAIKDLAHHTEYQFSTHEKQIFELQQELSKANRRIKELEEKIA